MSTTGPVRKDLLFTSMVMGGMMLLIVAAPAGLGFGVAVAAAFWWCWWLDAHPDH